MFKLALNAGHGYNTPGKRCLASIDPNQTREYILNKRICDKIQSMLSGYQGIEVLRIDDGSDQSISTRARKANLYKADFYLAIHHNAGINGGSGGGIEAYVYLTVDQNTKIWQRELYNAIIDKTGLRGNRSSPLRQADFGECRETSMPAVLLECGYMDSTVDTPIILTEQFADNVALGCVNAIVARSGTVKIVPEEPQRKPEGFLDVANLEKVYGWAHNGVNDDPLEIHIYLSENGKDVKCYSGIIANMFRQDLLDAGIGNGYHGFSYNYDLAKDVGPGVYKVRGYFIYGSNPQLVNSFTVTVPEATPKVEPVQNPPINPDDKPKDPPPLNPDNKIPDTTKDPEPSQDPNDEVKTVQETVTIIKRLIALIKKLFKL